MDKIIKNLVDKKIGRFTVEDIKKVCDVYDAKTIKILLDELVDDDYLVRMKENNKILYFREKYVYQYE